MNQGAGGGEQSEQCGRYVVRIGSISGKRRVISNWRARQVHYRMTGEKRGENVRK